MGQTQPKTRRPLCVRFFPQYRTSLTWPRAGEGVGIFRRDIPKWAPPFINLASILSGYAFMRSRPRRLQAARRVHASLQAPQSSGPSVSRFCRLGSPFLRSWHSRSRAQPCLGAIEPVSDRLQTCRQKIEKAGLFRMIVTLSINCVNRSLSTNTSSDLAFWISSLNLVCRPGGKRWIHLVSEDN